MQYRYYLLLIACISSVIAFAQPTFGGQPLGLDGLTLLPKPSTEVLPTLNTAQYQQEDEARGGNRFAAALNVDYRPSSHGTWTELENGTQVWRMQIQVPDAQGLTIFYDRLDWAPNSELYVYEPNGRQVLGAFSPESLGDRQRFLTGLILGDRVVIEYRVPQNTSRQPFRIWRIDAAYRDVEKDLLSFGFGSADPCHDNIACPIASDWQQERAAVARVMQVVEGGSGFCTGTLINNTAEDGRLLLMTAFHCMDGYVPLYDLWRFDFEYAAPSCAAANAEPFYPSVLGCDFLAGRRANDFLLLDLFPEDAANLNLYFVGWDRNDAPPNSGTVISHPRGDLKKISFSASPSTIFNGPIDWGNGVRTPPNHHFFTTYSDGKIEPGSSGAVLLNQDHRAVGVLQGSNGTEDCDASEGFFGRLSLAWQGGGDPTTRLREWLDPLGSDTMFIGGLQPGKVAFVRRDDGQPLGRVGVTFLVDDDVVAYEETATDGKIVFPSNLPNSGILTISLEKEDDYVDGVRVSDIVEMTQHILGLDTLGAPYRILACDVNLSSSVTTLDIIRMRKLILSVDDDYGDDGAKSWQFYPVDLTFPDPIRPWLVGTRSNSYSVDLSTEWTIPDFIAVKSGDANGSAIGE